MDKHQLIKMPNDFNFDITPLSEYLHGKVFCGESTFQFFKCAMTSVSQLRHSCRTVMQSWAGPNEKKMPEAHRSHQELLKKICADQKHRGIRTRRNIGGPLTPDQIVLCGRKRALEQVSTLSVPKKKPRTDDLKEANYHCTDDQPGRMEWRAGEEWRGQKTLADDVRLKQKLQQEEASLLAEARLKADDEVRLKGPEQEDARSKAEEDLRLKMQELEDARSKAEEVLRVKTQELQETLKVV